MLRTPICSYRRFVALAAGDDFTPALLLAYREPVIRRALWIKSRSLYAALDRHERGVAPLDDAARLALYRYFARLTTRSTPLMLFAGVGVVAVGDFDQACQAAAPDWRLGIFPSWSSTLQVVRDLLQVPAIRLVARYRVNETMVSHGGVLCYFTEEEPAGSQVLTPRYKIVAMRQDPQLRALVGDPARWWPWSELVAVIRAALPSATDAMAEEYIFSMLDGGVLIPSLQPPSIGPRPERYLHTVAARDFASLEIVAEVAELLDITDHPLPLAEHRFDADWQTLERHPWIAAFSAEPAASSAALRRGTTTQAVLRIDARSGGISQALVLQLGELVKSTPALWAHRYAIYQQAIAQHFAAGTVGSRIPLLELTHRIVKGAGIEDMLGAQRATQAPSLQEIYLTNKFLDADLTQAEQIELDVAELNQVLHNAAAMPMLEPPVIEAMVRCIQLGDKAALQHVATTSYAGALLNRFLHWNAADPLLLQLQTIWRREEQAAQPALVAEVTCGGGGRLRDISQRPLTYQYQIVVHGQPSVEPAYQIPLHELSVCMGEHGPMLWWERQAVPVIARQLSALQQQAFSPVVHMLLALSPQATDWGLRFADRGLPVRTARLCYRDLVLRPQSWLLTPAVQRLLLQDPGKDQARFDALLGSWRARYQVPRFVRLGDAEHNAVDLENPLCRHELAALVQDGTSRVCEEYFAATSPIVGDDGPLVGEAVVHLRLHAPGDRSQVSAGSLPAARPPAASLLETAATRQSQLFAPGTPWLFLKLYYGAGLGSHVATRQFFDDDLLGRFVAPLFFALEKSGQLANFHFVRYADPEAHLRLRLQPKEGSALALLEQIRERLDHQVQTGAFVRWVVDTYEREADRYGGPELITAAERLFTSDSRLCLRMLAAYHKDALEPETDLQMLLPIRTLNTLYSAFGFDRAARLHYFSELRSAHERVHPLGSDRKALLDAKYRQHGRAIQSLLLHHERGDAASELPLLRRKDVTAWFRSYELGAREVAVMYHDAVQRGTCSRPLAEVLQSLFHMHCNRLLGALDREYEVIYLSQRGVQAVHARLKQAAAKTTAPGKE